MLTRVEKAWLKKLEELLMNPPTPRIAFNSTGDPGLQIFDQSMAIELIGNEEFCNAIQRCGAELGYLKTVMPIHSTAC